MSSEEERRRADQTFLRLFRQLATIYMCIMFCVIVGGIIIAELT